MDSKGHEGDFALGNLQHSLFPSEVLTVSQDTNRVTIRLERPN